MKLWQVCPQFRNEEHVSKSIRKTHLGFPLLIYLPRPLCKELAHRYYYYYPPHSFPFMLPSDLIENPGFSLDIITWKN